VLPIIPQRGQLLSLRQPSEPIRHILIGNGIYIAPKRDATVIVGATKEEVGFDNRVTVGGVHWLLESAVKLVPALEQCSVERMWAGLRPKTPDNAPVLGNVPGWDNVIMATGHNSVGILLSAITGRAITELVVTGLTPEIIRPFSPDRFIHSERGLSFFPADKPVDNPQDE
jgi:glycine oxidase